MKNGIGCFGGLVGVLRRVPRKKQAALGVIYRCGCFTTWNRDWWLRSESRKIQSDGQTKDIKNIFTGGTLKFLPVWKNSRGSGRWLQPGFRLRLAMSPQNEYARKLGKQQ